MDLEGDVLDGGKIAVVFREAHGLDHGGTLLLGHRKPLLLHDLAEAPPRAADLWAKRSPTEVCKGQFITPGRRMPRAAASGYPAGKTISSHTDGWPKNAP